MRARMGLLRGSELGRLGSPLCILHMANLCTWAARASGVRPEVLPPLTCMATASLAKVFEESKDRRAL
ncbi:hypothetical protein SERLA73DRAFT_133127 [Serpula lacrymans var. lacrymans S7.3]|uniref:Uncharacterized protein n=1 Tax=Serpula lacrymans var. lacrymans (strain S7.3) TaxID=936435 RepID=F8PQH6_SERL3|nr:hypothetical protein SERLA73DRAFT_133127 [Serpula lacrymans var. lacrymans S7.3]